MSIERAVYKAPFYKGRQPQWVCPTCHRGVLIGVKGTFHYKETKVSRDARSHDDWDPEWIQYTYSCLLKCSNPQCGEFVSSAGDGSVDFDVDFDKITGEPLGQQYYEYFQPKFFLPHLNIFNCKNP